MATHHPALWMWADAFVHLERAERLHRQFFEPASPGTLAGGTRRPSWQPPIDVFETGQDIWVLVALPGVSPEQIQVVIDDATLTVVGERSLPVPAHAGVIHRLELPYGRFERRLNLPRIPVDAGAP